MQPKPLFIVNPQSGGGKTAREFPGLQSVIEERLGDFDLVWTAKTGHGIEIARRAAEDERPLVVAVGGDGTLSEIVTGLLQAKKAGSIPPEVGFIGQGTGCDFARGLGIPHEFGAYLERILSPARRKLDVGWVRYRTHEGETAERYFINILSVGVSGLVDRHVATANRAFGSKAAYFTSSLRGLFDMKRAKLEIRAKEGDDDRSRTLESYLIAFCNGSYFGSGMRVGPMARVDDGRLDVVSIGGSSKLAYALTSSGIYSGSHVRKKGVTHFSCDQAFVDLLNKDVQGEFLIDCDGEAIGTLPIEVRLLRSALTLRA